MNWERGSHHQQKLMDYGHEPERCCHTARLGSFTPTTPLLAIIYAKLFNKPLCHLITFDVTVGRLTRSGTWALRSGGSPTAIKESPPSSSASEAKHKQIIEALKRRECFVLGEIRK